MKHSPLPPLPRIFLQQRKVRRQDAIYLAVQDLHCVAVQERSIPSPLFERMHPEGEPSCGTYDGGSGWCRAVFHPLWHSNRRHLDAITTTQLQSRNSLKSFIAVHSALPNQFRISFSGKFLRMLGESDKIETFAAQHVAEFGHAQLAIVGIIVMAVNDSSDCPLGIGVRGNSIFLDPIPKPFIQP